MSFVGAFYLFMSAASDFLYGYTMELVFFSVVLFVLALTFFIVAYRINHIRQMKSRR